jgi:PEP-CTERM motif
MTRSIWIRFVFAALTSAILFAGTGQAKAGTIYSQAVNNPGWSFGSQTTTTTGNLATVYDDFTLSSTDTIRNVSWVGSYFNGPPATGAITGFDITFYANNAGGAPGTVLQTEHIAGNANETLLGNTTYKYNANLPTAVAAAGGTEFWMSIVADLDYPPQWGWDNSSQGDGVMYVSTGGVLTKNPASAPQGTTYDLAFALSDTPAVPEPATITMLGIGIAALAGYRLRSRNCGPKQA